MPDRGGPAAFAPALLVWFVAIASALAFRPVLPVDETRYLSVAWEMWWRGDLLVPRLNGVPYAHKPPLLFWTINLVWWLFGVSETAARLVPAAFTLGAAGVTAWIGRTLWPDRQGVAPVAALALLGFAAYAVYGSLVMFDVPLTVFVLLALRAVIARRGAWKWPLFSLAFGAALLTKGPVAAVFVLPPVLLAPLWRDAGESRTWGRWYLAATLAILSGIAVVMAWAIPAARAGGGEYADAILWGQTAGRVVHSFAHAEPWWFYAGILPVLLYPWILMPTLWRLTPDASRDDGLRFCVVAVLPALCVLAAVSGKQVHYLLPLLPFFALYVARRLHEASGRIAMADIVLPAVPVVLVGLALSLGPALSQALLHILPRLRVPAWIAHLPAAGGVLLIIGIIALCFSVRRGMLGGMFPAAAGAALLVLTVNVVGNSTVFSLYDLGPISRHLSGHQGTTMAYNRDYEGEFGFLGRLKQEIVRVDDDEMHRWISANPGARVIVRYDSPPKFVRGQPEFERAYRGQRIGVWVAPEATAETAGSGAD